jgi:nitroreductase
MTLTEPADTTPRTPPVTKALRRAAVQATLAPSVHNTQPWRLAIVNDTLEISADFERQLARGRAWVTRSRNSCCGQRAHRDFTDTVTPATPGKADQ